MKLWMAPAGLHIELANSKHVSAMAKLHASSFYHGWSINEFTTYLSAPHATPVYVACDAKNRLAGFMVLSLSGKECELLSINVEKKWRTKGIGNALLSAGIDDLMVSEVVSMFLEVDEANPSALALYARFGFVQVGVRPGYYPQKDGSRAKALVMRADFN